MTHFLEHSRISDTRLGKFLSIDPEFKKFSFQSSYCYAGNSPIFLIDKDGRGPIVEYLRNKLTPAITLSKWSGKVFEVSLNASACAGLVLVGAGGVVSEGFAIDPKGNFAITLGVGGFGDVFSGIGGVAYNGVKKGNFALGAEVSAKLGLTVYDKKSVLELGGKSGGSSEVPIEIKGEYGIAGGVAYGGDSFGVSLGVGLGAAISIIGKDHNLVFATNLADLGILEDSYNLASAYAKNHNGDLSTSVEINKEKGLVSVFFNVTTQNEKGEKTTKSILGTVLKVDNEKETISTPSVK